MPFSNLPGWFRRATVWWVTNYWAVLTNSGEPPIPGRLFDEDMSELSDVSRDVDEDDSDEYSYPSDTSNNDDFPDTFENDYCRFHVEDYLNKYSHFKEQREIRKKRLRRRRRREIELQDKQKEVMLPKLLEYHERKISQIRNAIRAIDKPQINGETEPIEILEDQHYTCWYDLYSSQQCKWLEDYEYPVGHQLSLSIATPATSVPNTNVKEPGSRGEVLARALSGRISLSEAHCSLDLSNSPGRPGEIMIDAWTIDEYTCVKGERVHVDLAFLNDTYVELKLPAAAVYGPPDERDSTPLPPDAPLWFEFYGERRTLETLWQRDADSKELYLNWIYE